MPPRNDLPDDRAAKSIMNLVTGKAKTLGLAQSMAGYKKPQPFTKFMAKNGVRSFLKALDQAAIDKYHQSMAEKMIDVFMDALGAEKLAGKLDQVMPDHKVRIEVATKLSEIMNIKPVEKAVAAGPTTNIQYNYFSTDKSKQEDFNKQFIDFVSGFKPGESPAGAREGVAKEPQIISEVEEVQTP